MKDLRIPVFIFIAALVASLLSAKITRYEAEDLDGESSYSKVIVDPDAWNDTARVSLVDEHIVGYLQYGPYDSLDPGHYVATFRLKRGTGINNSMKSLINPVCLLDIVSGDSSGINRFHVYQQLYASSFDSLDEYQSFRVAFYLPQKVGFVEFRIKWHDSVDIYSDYVDLNDGPDTSKIVYAINLQDLDAMLGLPHDPDSFNFEMADRRILLASIQGGLNRDKAQFVLLHDFHTYEAMGIYRWLYALDIPFEIISYDFCADSLISQKSACFSGCVYFDPDTLDTIAMNNPPEEQKYLFQIKAIATNFAALESLLIITPRDSQDIDTSVFPISRDLIDTTAYPFLSDSTGETARIYNEDSLFGSSSFNKDIIFKLFPYFCWKPYSNAAEKLTDFTIQNKYWSFYEYIDRDTTIDYFEDSLFDTTHYIMGWSDEAWVYNEEVDSFEYYCGEREHIYIASEAGKLWIGDMNRIHNLSFFSKVAHDTDYAYPQTVPSTPLLENKAYISFLTMDGDNPVLWTDHYRKDWDAPQRGSIPVSWGIPPKLKDYAPCILQHLYETKTTNDCIIGEISGLAWHFTNLFDFSDYPTMLDTAAKYLDSLNIKVVKLMGNRNKDLADIHYLQRFAKEYDDIGGFVEGYWPPDEQGYMMVKENDPSIRLAVNQPRPPDITNACQVVVDSIKSIIDSNPDKPLFLPVIYNIYHSKYSKNNSLFDKLDSIKTMLDEEYGDSIAYLRLDVMMDLAKMQYNSTNIGNEIIKNGGFESGFSYWDTSGTVNIDSSKSHGDDKSLKLQGASSAIQVIEVDEEQLYRCKVWLYPDTIGTGTYGIIWYKTSGNPDTSTVFSYEAKDTVNVVTEWLFYFRDLKSPANACSAKVFCETDTGTVCFDDIAVKVIDPLFSDDSLATAVTSQRKLFLNSSSKPCFVYQSKGRVFYYSKTGTGTYDQVCFGDGEYPTLASYTDTASNEIIGTVWLNDKVVFFSRFDGTWSEPCSLITYSGSDSMFYTPPCIAIDDSGTAHLSWGIITKHHTSPDSATYQVRYSTFDAGLDTPSVIENDTLEEGRMSISGWADNTILSSLELLNDTLPAIAWSRTLGASKDTIFFMQMSGDTWPDEPDTVSSSSDESTDPVLLSQGNYTHIVWEENGDKMQYRNKTIFGWSTIETISDPFKQSRNPQLVYCDSLMCIYTEEPQMYPDHRSNIVYRVRKGCNNWSHSRTIGQGTVLLEHPQCYAMKQYSERDLHTIWTKGNGEPLEVQYKITNLP